MATIIDTNTIRTFAAEAAAHGDILMAAIAHRAIGEGYSDLALSDSDRARVDSMTRDEAMTEVRELLTEAERAGFVEGAEVEAGEPGTDEYDTGWILEIEGNEVTVGWSTGIRTTQHYSLLRLI